MTIHRSTVDPRIRPTFTTEHYRRIADTLAMSKPPSVESAKNKIEHLIFTGANDKWNELVSRLVTAFEWDNANFDRERFLTWCYNKVSQGAQHV